MIMHWNNLLKGFKYFLDNIEEPYNIKELLSKFITIFNTDRRIVEMKYDIEYNEYIVEISYREAHSDCYSMEGVGNDKSLLIAFNDAYKERFHG